MCVCGGGGGGIREAGLVKAGEAVDDSVAVAVVVQ